jgi:hypothetical protein
MRADADSRLTAARQEPRGGAWVPNSQIEMVVKGDVDGREGWLVCGRIEPGPGRAENRKVGLYVVVRQGDVIARGDSREDFGRWAFEVRPDDGQLTLGPAIASAVAIVEKEDPTGLETLTWVQRVTVVETRGEPQNPPFPPSELTVTKEGEVADDRAVSSSLGILEQPRGPGGFQWEQELEIRKVVDVPQ